MHSYKWPQGKQLALSLTFDDGRNSQWQEAIPLLDSHGACASFYVMPSAVSENVEIWQSVLLSGHEVGNHSLTHPCSGNFRFSRGNALEEMTLEHLEQKEIIEANRRLFELLNMHPTTFAYPCGQTTVGRGMSAQSYVPIVARHFLAGRLFFSEMHNTPEYCDLHQLYAVSMDNLEPSDIDRLLKAAASENGWLILAGHDVGAVGARQTVSLKTLEHICHRSLDPVEGIWLGTVAEVASVIHTQRQDL